MDRHKFLGSTDVGIYCSLLKDYRVPTKLPDSVQLNKIKHEGDLMLIELGSLLNSRECDEIIDNINQHTFENMSDKYDIQKRNSSRLVVMDDRLARTLWRRLKFSHRITKLVQNTQPLGFNVQGKWEMSGVNMAMRLNNYGNGEYFTPHKDAQYAPSGDERSLFSSLIYLNDNFEKGETKFYFPKQLPTSNIKGLTIKEEIEAYGGLENGYECVILKPKKGYAVLFTHNLMHEATAPEMENSLNSVERLVSRTDVLVERKTKPLGFAVCSEEKEDYLACLNFFREAQQCELKARQNFHRFVKTVDIGELYERSLSIRYCYPRLLELKMKNSIADVDYNEKPFINRLPLELWLQIFKHLHEQDIQNLIFAFPQFQLLKIVWKAQEIRNFEKDTSRPKFIPILDTQYGSRTLFRFSDSDFFYEHVHECCRVAAVYAFFLLGHDQDSTTYTVRYDRNTQEVCEVEMERILADVFYKRNCYGSLYQVCQKNKNKRQPMIDFDRSVDRTYMMNRHQSQFIGQDLLSRFYLKTCGNDPADWISVTDASDDDSSDDAKKPTIFTDTCDILRDRSSILAYERFQTVYDLDEKLVDQDLDSDYDAYAEEIWEKNGKNDVVGYRECLIKQIEQHSGASLCRMLSRKDYEMLDLCCFFHRPDPDFEIVREWICNYNHLIFDFDTHQLTVEHLPDQEPTISCYDSLLHNCVQLLQESVPQQNPILFYRVNIQKLTEETKGFNHASCQVIYPDVKVDQFSFLDYTYLSHVHLVVAQKANEVFVLAIYGGVTAL